MLFVNATYQVDHEQDIKLSEADVAHTGRECKPTHLLRRSCYYLLRLRPKEQTRLPNGQGLCLTIRSIREDCGGCAECGVLWSGAEEKPQYCAALA